MQETKAGNFVILVLAREKRETHAVRLYKREWDKKTNLVLIREVVSYGKN